MTHVQLHDRLLWACGLRRHRSTSKTDLPTTDDPAAQALSGRMILKEIDGEQKSGKIHRPG
jgi:hypothetical protein